MVPPKARKQTTPHDAPLLEATTRLKELEAKKAGHEAGVVAAHRRLSTTARDARSSRMREAAALTSDGGGVAVAEVENEEASAELIRHRDAIQLLAEAIRMQTDIVNRVATQRGRAIFETRRAEHVALVRRAAHLATELARISTAELSLCQEMQREGYEIEPLRLDGLGSVRAISGSRLWYFVERAVERGYLTAADRAILSELESKPIDPSVVTVAGPS